MEIVNDLTHSFILAQYFYLADQIIGLEDSQLLLHASETSNNADPGSTKLQITTDTVQNTTKLQAQTRAANDAAQDAKRKIGDFSLYGKNILLVVLTGR